MTNSKIDDIETMIELNNLKGTRQLILNDINNFKKDDKNNEEITKLEENLLTIEREIKNIEDKYFDDERETNATIEQQKAYQKLKDIREERNKIIEEFEQVDVDIQEVSDRLYIASMGIVEDYEDEKEEIDKEMKSKGIDNFFEKLEEYDNINKEYNEAEIKYKEKTDELIKEDILIGQQQIYQKLKDIREKRNKIIEEFEQVDVDIQEVSDRLYIASMGIVEDYEDEKEEIDKEMKSKGIDNFFEKLEEYNNLDREYKEVKNRYEEKSNELINIMKKDEKEISLTKTKKAKDKVVVGPISSRLIKNNQNNQTKDTIIYR